MPQSLAERLGFATGDRVLIVHVDDLGMCHAANEGGFGALESGPATCGSIMVPCPWFGEAAALARENPELDVGIHLTLNAEWEHYRWGPVASRDRVPSLLDKDGFLPRTTAEVIQKAEPAEVEIELRAQIQRALDAGVDVTHIDSHMGTIFFPKLLPVYAGLAREFKLPAFAARPPLAQLERIGLTGAKWVFDQLADSLEADGFPVLDGFDSNSLGFEPGQGLEHNRRRLAGFTNGVSYLICHAAKGGEELEAITPAGAHAREFERSFYGGAMGSAELEREGCKTLGMRPLRDLLRAG